MEKIEDGLDIFILANKFSYNFLKKPRKSTKSVGSLVLLVCV